MRAVVMAVVALVACGDTTTPAGEAEVETADTREVGDVTGAPLEGTTLAGITVTWPAALELCNAWQEGASIEEERAHQVRMQVPRQTRSDLEYDSFAAQTIDGISMRRGPFADDRVQPIASSRISRYALVPGQGYDAVGVELEHDLGPGGRLIESYSVGRSAGQTDGVIVGAGYEVTFAWAPEGSDVFHRLEACAVPAEYEAAVAVLPGIGDGINAQLVRFYATQDMDAGSSPVRLIASQVYLSDASWRVFEVRGQWAQIYAAKHHNFAETSRLDFTRDLANRHLVFAPLANGDKIWDGAIETVQLDGIGGGEVDAGIVITRLSEDGVASDVSFRAARWRRVDAAYLGRQLPDCAGREIGAVGFGDHVAQLVVCADDAGPRGKRLAAVVPVLWNVAPGAIGNVYEAITVTNDGWTLAIDDSTLNVQAVENGAFIIDVLDAGGASVANSYTTLSELAPTQSDNDPVVASAPGVALSIDRLWAAQGEGRSAIYAPVRMSLSWADNAYTVEDWDRLAYVNSHHNWYDTLAATTDDGHVLNWKIEYVFGGDLVQTVWVTGPDGDAALAPTVVEGVPSPGR